MEPTLNQEILYEQYQENPMAFRAALPDPLELPEVDVTYNLTVEVDGDEVASRTYHYEGDLIDDLRHIDRTVEIYREELLRDSFAELED